ncbi:MAG TPA: hypothetical protein DDX84_09735 [Nitrospiraceae bacterium]|nr:hypothetical protein [Nitrospiraceae bacterium]
MAKANLVIKDRFVFHDGSIVEIKIWEVPASKDKPHGYKYSFVYVVNGKRIIGYDNAEGQGDHRHDGDKVETYDFKDIDKLFDDFYNDIRRVRGDEN